MVSPGLDQLRQRIWIFAHLKPFSRDETQLHIEHRSQVAGKIDREVIHEVIADLDVERSKKKSLSRPPPDRADHPGRYPIAYARRPATTP